MRNQQSDPTRTDLTRLIGLNRYAASLRLQASHVRARQTGQYLSRFKGRGMEFDESRLYQPGDDVRNIDWRVTARTGSAYTKLFREERERPVFISVDLRAPMFFATRGRFKSVIASELAALLAWTAHRQGDRIGGEIFNEIEHDEFRPRRGQDNLLHLLKRLAAAQAAAVTEPISLEQPLRRLQHIAHPGSLVCVISDFRGLDANSESQLTRIARHSQLVLFHVYDPLEMQLPERGRYRLGDGRRLLSIDAGDRNLQRQYTERYRQRSETLTRLNHRAGIQLLECRTDESPLERLQMAFGLRTSARQRTA